jgi:hypothetical protein
MSDDKQDWVYDGSSCPPLFLPSWLDQNKLRDITTMSDNFRVFVDIETGKVHRGQDYYEQYMREVKSVGRSIK